MKNPISTEHPSNVPEVVNFINAKAFLAQFIQTNSQLIEQLRQLTEQYNQTREAAEKAVRARGVACGEFDLYQQRFSVDGEKLLNAVGREAFIAMGGSIKKKSDASIGYKQAQMALARNQIDHALYDEIVKITDVYHVPQPLQVP